MSSSSASTVSLVKSRPEAPSVALRASVLEAAISVGFRNSVMKKWMFDPVEEGDEDEHTEHTSSTPALTSPSTSEESAMSPYSFFCPPGKPNSLSSSDSGPVPAGVPYALNNNGSISQAGGSGYPYSHDERNGKDAFGKLDLAAVPSPRNKLRKQKTPPGGVNDAGNGYESDGGYVSDFTRKAKKGLGWRSKGKATADNEDGDSDGGYRSEAASSVKGKARRKAKEKEREKDRNNKYFLHDVPSPPPPPAGLDVRDPGALLDTIKASALSDSNSPSGSAPTFIPGPASSSGHGHTMTTTTTTMSALDGYLTDSASTEKRGRTKKKSKAETTKSKSKSRPTSPSSSTEDRDKDAFKKKKSLFRFRGRSASRDAKERERERGKEEEAPPPMPEWKPPVPLPIAERFARSGAATPVGGVSASASASTSVTQLETASGLTKMSLELRTSGSLDTLVPPRLDELARSDSPWSNRSAPGWIGAGENGSATGDGRNGFGSVSLDLPRDRMKSGANSPFSFVQIPEDAATTGNGEKQQFEPQPQRSVSPIVTTNVSSVDMSSKNNGSPDIGRSPTKRIGKLFTGFVHSSDKNKDKDGNASPSSSSKTPIPIVHPNPQLNGKDVPPLKIPNPLEIAAALTSSARIPKENRNASPADESFMIIEEDDAVPTPLRQQRFTEVNINTNATSPSGSEPSSSIHLSPSTAAAPGSSARPSEPTTSALATRRRALLHGLGLDITPTQSRSVTPVPGAIAGEEDVKRTRASVLAYYQVPLPSPPPKGPLPAPPQVPSAAISINTSGVGVVPSLSSPRTDNELLSPGRAFASRSPSPLGPNGGSQYLDAASRSPSPGSAANQFGMRRGRESPFPSRPILPPQDSRQLVERVERYKALFAAEGATSDERGEQEVIDKHSSEYIRQARARGEKRVYFDARQSFISDHYADADEYGDTDMYGDGVDPVVPNIEVAEIDDLDHPNGFDEEADERLRFSELDSPTQIRELLREGVKGFDDEEESEHLSLRRSFATSSVYSNYSVLEAEESARFRDGLVRRVAALYDGDQNRGRLLREKIPEVPKVPSQFRGDGAAGQLGRTQSKITSSPYRF